MKCRLETYLIQRKCQALERTARLCDEPVDAPGLVPPRQLREADTSLYSWANLSLQAGLLGRERPWASQYAG